MPKVERTYQQREALEKQLSVVKSAADSMREGGIIYNRETGDRYAGLRSRQRKIEGLLAPSIGEGLRCQTPTTFNQ